MKKAMMFIVSTIVTLVTSILAVIGNMFGTTITAEAATLSDLNRPEVFLKQQEWDTCTLCSAAMLVRRVAMMRGDSDWMNITESTLKECTNWYEVGLSWDFTYNGIRIVHQWLPSNYNEKVDRLLSFLSTCPEGIIVYDEEHPHGILLLDCSDGTFYCADPANSTPSGRIPISESLITIGSLDALWYCTSPLVYLEEPKIDSYISIDDALIPSGSLPLGKPFTISGMISSNCTLNNVNGGVCYLDGTPTSEYICANPNMTNYDLLKNFDADIRFNYLPAGDYIYRIEAGDCNGYTALLVDSRFSIVDDSPSTITISGETSPVHLNLNERFTLSGIISSHHSLKKVFGGVYTSNGEQTSQFFNTETAGTSYDLLTEFDPAISFNELAEGTYIYKVYATDIKDYTQLLIEKSFTVTKPEPVYTGKYSKGIDVSSFQGDSIDWSAVYNSGIEWAIIRAGSTKYENAVYSMDSCFKKNIEQARKAGLKIGAYIYTSAVTEKEIRTNINDLFETLDGIELDFPVYLDVEESSRQTAIGKSALTDVILYGCELIRNAGYKAGIYSNQDWLTNNLDVDEIRSQNVEIWKAAWVEDEPLYHDLSKECVIWQYSDKGSVAGISEPVDLDLKYISDETDYTESDPDTTYLKGDVNCDGAVDVSDGVLLARFITGDSTARVSDAGLRNADCDKNGNLDSDDIDRILKFIARMI